MNIFTQQQLKELLHEIFLIGQESESIQTSDFIKVIEIRLLSILIKKV